MIKDERMVLPGVVRVEWQDTIEYTDGRSTKVSPWRTNQLQNTFSTLVAALLKGDAAHSGLTYFAVGEGLGSWDTIPPTQPKSDTTLTTEIFRKALVPATDIVYLDPSNDMVVAGPTRKIQITVIFTTAEGNGDLREWGMFGGDATATLDSGLMADWVVHGLITKDSSMTITRVVKLEIGLP